VSQIARAVAAATLLAAGVAAASCSPPPPKSEAERTITDPVRGVRFIVPQGWRSFDAEIRSTDGSLLTLRVYDLVEADKRFVAGLPDTLVPQLKEWAEFYYKVLGEPTRTATTVGGLPAAELVYPIRVLPKDPPSKVIYWVVVRKTRLFVMRAAFPAKGVALDEPVLRNVIAGWTFIEPTGEAD
jgi:hypothetical protein